MTDAIHARIADGEQAREAMSRFLAPAFDVVQAEYLTKLADIAARPMTETNRAGMEKLALAVKVASEVRAQIEGLIADGKLAQAEHRRADRIAELPAEQRKWAWLR